MTFSKCFQQNKAIIDFKALAILQVGRSLYVLKFRRKAILLNRTHQNRFSSIEIPCDYIFPASRLLSA